MGNYDTQYVRDFLQYYESTRMYTLLDVQDDHLIDHCRIQPLRYGDVSWKRRWIHSDETVQVGARRERVPKEPATTFTELDLADISDALMVGNFQYAGNPAMYDQHAREKGVIFREAFNNLLWSGHSTAPRVYGVIDKGATSTGSHNDPIMCGAASNLGGWSAVSNIRGQVIQALQNMDIKGFRGLGNKALVCPTFVRPMLTQLITNTVVPITQWFQSTVGLPIIFDRQVDTAGSPSSFVAAIVDTDDIIPAMTPLTIANFYDDWRQSYVQDFDIMMCVGYGTKLPADGSTSSGYYKGVCRLTDNYF